ncbi:MAG: saccharopine dehydrogenase NADP-binding domain-containing protein [Elusimicrobia bacterium]|nr:saccharopine dehydrogenase NADP-binding domain-containing protein [Elusimicrobiota bacterium]
MKPRGFTVAVLGAFGQMAEAALHDLAANPRVSRVLAADLSIERSTGVLSKIAQRKKIKAIPLDLTRIEGASRKLAGAACILNAAWYEHNIKAMDLALALKAHYVDLGGLYHTTIKQLRRAEEFRKAKLLGILGCGSTPGITNLMAAGLSEGFDTIETVGIYDASHDPALSQNRFLPPFSIRTMLAEYEAPAPVWSNGKLREIPAHGNSEELEFRAPIGRVSAGAVIHSEVGTLPAFFKGKGLKNLAFKIAYPQKLKQQLELLSGLGLSSKEPIQVNASRVSPQDFMTALAQTALHGPSANPQDFEILRVAMSGTRSGKPLRITWDCEIRPSRTLSAGAMGVGFSAAIAADLILRGETLLPWGVAAPEGTLSPKGFFRELKARKVFSLREMMEHPLTL